MAFDRENVIEKIRNNVCYIEFEKKDGTTRKMSCTMKPDLLPPRKESDVNEAEQKEKKVNLEVVTVYDLEAEGFRSFHLDKLKLLEVV